MSSSILRVRRPAVLAAATALLGCSFDPGVYPVTPLSMERLEGRYPDLSLRERVTFAVFGDSGRGNETQFEIGAVMAEVCREMACDFAIGTGDSIYESGVDGVDDDDFVENFEDPYAPFGPFPFWMTLGNHDWEGDVQAEIDYSLHSERWLMPAPSYAIPALPEWLDIVAFDTQTVRGDSTLADKQQEAMMASLCSANGWAFVFGHHPASSSGPHGGDTDVDRYVDTIDVLCGVDVFFAGHDHHQEHLTLGRYEQVIQGAAATVRDVDRLDNSIFAVDEPGFAVVDVMENRMSMSFYVEGEAEGEGRAVYSWTTSR